MALLDGYTVEQLTKILTWSRWILGIAAVVTATFGVFNLYIGDKIYKIQKAEKELAEQRLKAAEEKIAPRALTEYQTSRIYAVLVRTSKTQNVPLVIATQMMNAESLAYGRQLASVAEQAGWSVSFTELSTHSFSGLAVFHNPETANSPSLDAIRQALIEAGIPYDSDNLDVKRTPIQHEPAIYIIVGHK